MRPAVRARWFIEASRTDQTIRPLRKSAEGSIEVSVNEQSAGRSADRLPAISRRRSLAFGGLGALALFLALGILVQARLAASIDQALMAAASATRPLQATDAFNWIFRLGYAPLDGAIAGLGALLVFVSTRSLRLALIPLALFAVVGTQAVTRLVVARPGPQAAYALPREYSEHAAVGSLDQTDAAVRGAFVAATGAGDANDQGNGSFPSGHAARLGTLATIAALALGSNRRIRPAARHAATATLTVVTLLVGYSTLYFGYHWPSDVLGGYALGGGVSLLAWALLFQAPGDRSDQSEPALARSAGQQRSGGEGTRR
jgi:membrane-associated phospholipid phosphatase